jgi:hypothetical protein
VTDTPGWRKKSSQTESRHNRASFSGEKQYSQAKLCKKSERMKIQKEIQQVKGAKVLECFPGKWPSYPLN